MMTSRCFLAYFFFYGRCMMHKINIDVDFYLYAKKEKMVGLKMKEVFSYICFRIRTFQISLCFNGVQYLERVEEFDDVCSSADIAEQQLGQFVSCQVTLYSRDRKNVNPVRVETGKMQQSSSCASSSLVRSP